MRLIVIIGILSCVLSSCGAPRPSPRTADLHGSGTIYFVPMDGFPADQLQQLASFYEGTYHVSISTLSPIAIPLDAWDESRHQLIAERVIDAMKGAYPQLASDTHSILIGFTTSDMYIQSYDWRFAFGLRQQNHLAVVSSARMAIQAPLDPSEIAQTRLRKVVTKDIGLLYYHLAISDDPRSVLYGNILSLDDLDAVSEEFYPQSP